MKSTSIILALSTLVLCHPLLAAKSYTLLDAVNQGLVKASVEGKGGHTGKVLSLKITNLQKKALEISLDAGLKFQSADSTTQDMILTRSRTFEIDGNVSRNYSLYGMCIQQHSGGPGEEDMFSPKAMAQGNLLKMVEYVAKKNYQNDAAQNAVWVFTDDNDISSIYDDDPKITKDLQLFASNLKGVEAPWFSVQRKTAPGIDLSREPATLHATFKYQLYEDTRIDFLIFDSNGKLVKTLRENHLQRRGINTMNFTWTTNRLPKGKYYIRVLNQNGIIEEKVIVL